MAVVVLERIRETLGDEVADNLVRLMTDVVEKENGRRERMGDRI